LADQLFRRRETARQKTIAPKKLIEGLKVGTA